MEKFYLITKWDSGGGAIIIFKDGVPLNLDHRIYGEHIGYIDTIKGILEIGETEVDRLIGGQATPLGEWIPDDS
ncbi:unnamed protein product [marine sediment metagenome]|uniref:Uncharacterized protein n=1 Tax=marine sediment metagenome TaxID=412755 RepID=X0YHB1_9ZZZZ